MPSSPRSLRAIRAACRDGRVGSKLALGDRPDFPNWGKEFGEGSGLGLVGRNDTNWCQIANDFGGLVGGRGTIVPGIECYQLVHVRRNGTHGSRHRVLCNRSKNSCPPWRTSELQYVRREYLQHCYRWDVISQPSCRKRRPGLYNCIKPSPSALLSTIRPAASLATDSLVSAGPASSRASACPPGRRPACDRPGPCG